MNSENDYQDPLHIPNIGFHQWIAATSQDTISLSIKDSKIRSFSVKFYLEDQRARTPYVFLQTSNNNSFSHINGKTKIDFWIETNMNGLIESIFVGLKVSSAEEAFSISANCISPILSILSFRYRRPFNISKFEIIDGKNKAMWHVLPFNPVPVNLDLKICGFVHHHPLGAMLALYREGMNSNSPAYRFLCFFKIFEAWKNRKAAFKVTDNKFKEIKGEILKRKKHIVTKKLLSGMYHEKYHLQFIGKTLGACFSLLNEIRDIICHPFLDKNNSDTEFINHDFIEQVEAVGAYASLVEKIATILLDDELDVLKSIDPDVKENF